MINLLKEMIEPETPEQQTSSRVESKKGKFCSEVCATEIYRLSWPGATHTKNLLARPDKI